MLSRRRLTRRAAIIELFAEKRDQAQIEDAMDERKLINIAVAESPTSAFKPASPKPLLNAALGLLTALFLAAGTVYLVESSRTTVATARELESLSRYPVLATAPYDAPPTNRAIVRLQEVGRLERRTQSGADKKHGPGHAEASRYQ